MKPELIKQGMSLMLEGLELDPTDENFRDTPNRVKRAYQEIFSGLDNTDEQIKKILSTKFPSKFSQMIIVKDIHVFSMCPHHFLPVDYTVSVAYLPSEDGTVLGISKLPRLIEVLAKRPVLQEQFTEDITTHLMSLDGVRGAGCIVRGMHYCMLMRGIKQTEAATITSSLKGVFLDDIKTRNEFNFLVG
jgi:GTP cyclohydrolase I